MKKFKFTKNIKFKGINFNKNIYGIWAIQTTTYGILSIKHINNIKQYLQKNIKKFKFNITLNRISTKKPLDTRMGGGKSSIFDLQYFLKPGFIFLEFYNISDNMIFSIFKIITNKIPIKIKLINIK